MQGESELDAFHLNFELISLENDRACLLIVLSSNLLTTLCFDFIERLIETEDFYHSYTNNWRNIT